MNIYSLVIETTRRCNLVCDHCLRGNAESLDIKPEYMESFIVVNEIGCIDSVTFTGGEPSLNIKAMRDFIKICTRHRVEVANFYISTNGHNAGDAFIKVLMDMYLFCADNEISSVEISVSDYHDPPSANQVNKLKILKFVGMKERLKSRQLIPEGRAKENNLAWHRETLEPEVFEFEDGNIIEGAVYLNVKGEIIPGCDFSYKRQSSLKLGNVSTPLMQLIGREKTPNE